MDDVIGRWREVNLANWNERVPIHLAGSFYDLPGFREKRTVLRDFEIAEVGDVTGRSLVHLQCHFGQDTLSWAAHGARVSGLDFSGPAVEAARGLAAELEVEAEFVQADVYEAVTAFEGRTFDIVYTGFGALTWLPDLSRWARVVSDLLKPGGFLYLSEFHPLTGILDDETGTVVTYDYFDENAKVWNESVENMPWLHAGHRLLLRQVCILAARMETDPDMGVSALQALGAALSKLGATPTDETKVNHGDGDETDPSDEFFGGRPH